MASSDVRRLSEKLRRLADEADDPYTAIRALVDALPGDTPITRDDLLTALYTVTMREGT